MIKRELKAFAKKAVKGIKVTSKRKPHSLAVGHMHVVSSWKPKKAQVKKAVAKQIGRSITSCPLPL